MLGPRVLRCSVTGYDAWWVRVSPPPPITSKSLLIYFLVCLYSEHCRKMAPLDTNDPHFIYDDIVAARKEDEVVI